MTAVMRFCLLPACVIAASAFSITHARLAAEPADGPTSFIHDVAPILKENCFACHDAKRHKGRLDMTTYARLRQGGDSDDPIAPGAPADSLLYQRITGTGAKRMPPEATGAALPAEKIASIQRWIKGGAMLDKEIAAGADLLRELRVRWSPPMPPAVYSAPAPLTALAFTPDARELVAGGYYELTVWSTQSGLLEKRIRTRSQRAYAIRCLPGGSLAVAGGRPGQEGDVRLYNFQAAPSRDHGGAPMLDGVNDRAVMVRELAEADDSFLCLALSRDSTKLAAAGCDRVVRIWNISASSASGQLEQTFENHADWVLDLAFTPDARYLLTASRDKTAKVWDRMARDSVVTFPDHRHAVTSIISAPDGAVALSGGEDGLVRWWSIADGKQLRSISAQGRGVSKLAFTPNRPILVTCGNGGAAHLWNTESGALVRRLNGHADWITALAVSPDGETFATGSLDGEVRIWRSADGSLVKSFIASPGLSHPANASKAQP
jgi:hypothetical protein